MSTRPAVDSTLKRTLVKYLREIAFAAVLCVLGYLLVQHWAAVASTLAEHALITLYAAAISVTAISVQTLNFLMLLEHPGQPPFAATVHMWAMSSLANYLGPFQPGLALRLAFFKRHGVPISATTTTTLRQLHLSMWTATGLAAAGLWSPHVTIEAVGAAALCVFLCWPWLLRLVRGQLWRLQRMWPRLAGREAALTTLLSTVPPLRLGLFIAQYVLIAASLYGVYWAFGAPLAVHEALLLAVASVLSTLVSITPNNLGVQEALLGYVAHLGGLTTAAALSVALVFRIAHVCACLTLLVVTLRRRSAAA